METYTIHTLIYKRDGNEKKQKKKVSLMQPKQLIQTHNKETQTNGATGVKKRKRRRKREKKKLPRPTPRSFSSRRESALVEYHKIGDITQLRPNSLLTSFPASKIKEDNPNYQIPAILCPFPLFLCHCC